MDSLIRIITTVLGIMVIDVGAICCCYFRQKGRTGLSVTTLIIGNIIGPMLITMSYLQKGVFDVQWVVIMYSLLDKRIVDYESCESEDDACDYLKRTSKNKYDEECGKHNVDEIQYDMASTNEAHLVTPDGEWTREIISVY